MGGGVRDKFPIVPPSASTKIAAMLKKTELSRGAENSISQRGISQKTGRLTLSSRGR